MRLDLGEAEPQVGCHSKSDSGHLHFVERDPEVGLADLDEVILQLRELLHQAVEDLGGRR